jgi:enterochelin esterase-like enzyme
VRRLENPAMKPDVIAALESRGIPDAHALDSFLGAHEFPILTGSTCTFVFRGAADAVFLQHMIFGLPSRQPFTRLPGTDLWYLPLDLPENSRIEYKFEIARGGRSELIEDPLNPHKSRDPFGTNSVCHGLGYVTPEWTLPNPETRIGTLDEVLIPSRHLERSARVTLYLPARFRRSRSYPVLIVHDGGDYLNFASMKTVLDNLIHRLDVAETIVALTHPVQRLQEYANYEPHEQFLVEELLPWLDREFPTIVEPHGRGVMGASFGAVASLATAVRFPDTFGRLLLQSGSFAFTDIGMNPRGPVFEPVVEFVNEFRRTPRRVAERVFVSCGTYESLIYENRSLVPFLQAAGMEVRYVEARDGHNWENWRDRMREGLSWLFPGPSRMVYE